jgi:hypothetical protein
VSQTGRGLPGDTRTGSQTAMSAVTKACRAVRLRGTGQTMYDCAGRAAALLKA